MDNQLCYDFAFKHISCAYVVWAEISNGYDEPGHYMKFVGHMANAEEHLIDRHDDLPEQIREARKLWWDAKLTGATYRPPFEEWLQTIWEMILVDLHDNEELSQDDQEEGEGEAVADGERADGSAVQ